MPKFTPSFAAALKVAELLEAFLPESIMLSKCFPTIEIKGDELTEKYYDIQAYQNGREQGVTVNLHGLTVTFYVCMHCSNDIVGYYKGTAMLQGLSDSAYEAGFKGFDSIVKCSEAIAKEIEKLLNI
jgi:hypothetical protein